MTALLDCFQVESRITIKPLVEIVPCVGGATISLLKVMASCIADALRHYHDSSLLVMSLLRSSWPRHLEKGGFPGRVPMTFRVNKSVMTTLGIGK
jgi:hypothetical protein